MASQMMLGHYNFMCRFTTSAVLPHYKGSTFRGVFGHALKRIVCVLKNQECEQCPLKGNCLYAMVFETTVARHMGGHSNVSAAPHPFVIEPPLTQQTQYKEGHAISCRLILFGDVNKQIPYFVYAFNQMGETGIGRRINGTRGKFELLEVRNGNSVLYTREKGILKTGPSIPYAEFPSGYSDFKGQRQSRVTIFLETPLRLKFKNRLSRADLPFHVLIRAALRRISSLFNAWGDGEPDLDYKGLVDRAHKVKTVNNDLGWFDWRRYSNRQESKMFMGGIIGRITYEGKLDEFYPLLKFCQEVHIGKATSFGLGKIRVGERAMLRTAY